MSTILYGFTYNLGDIFLLKIHCHNGLLFCSTTIHNGRLIYNKKDDSFFCIHKNSEKPHKIIDYSGLQEDELFQMHLVYDKVLNLDFYTLTYIQTKMRELSKIYTADFKIITPEI